jgi:uncharacterized protein (TIGR03435 family)
MLIKPIVLAAAFLIAAQAVPQDQAGSPTFDVVSVKANVDATLSSASQPSPDRYVGINRTLADLVQEAWNLPRWRVLEGPAWIRSGQRYDVLAKAGFTPTREQMRQMLQAALADRFQLRTHHETREMPVYLLHLARTDRRLGSDLRQTTADCEPIEERRRQGDPNAAPPRDAAGRPLCSTLVMARPSPGGKIAVSFRANGIPLAELAGFMEQYVRQPIVDETGLAGPFDIDLTFDPAVSPTTGAEPDVAPTMFVAL